MARKKIGDPAYGVVSQRTGIAVFNKLPTVAAVGLSGAVELVTVDRKIDPSELELYRGAIVRIRPGVDWEDSQVVDLRNRLESVALKVIVLAKPASKTMPEKVFREKTARVSHRDVVNQLVDESGVDNVAGLKMVVEEIMGKVGL